MGMAASCFELISAFGTLAKLCTPEPEAVKIEVDDRRRVQVRS